MFRMSCASRWRRMKISCIVRPAQVEVAISQPELFVGLGPVHLERRRRRGVVNDQLLDADLDAAGLELGVLLAVQPRGDRSLDADDELVAQLTAAGLELLARVGLEDDLGDSVAVAQVDEDQPAEVAIGVDPAIQDDRFARRRRWSIRRRYVFFSVAWNQCEVKS